MTVAGPPAVFARKYRQQLSPDTPLLFASVDQRYLGNAPLGDDETAVAIASDFPRIIGVILQLLPKTRRVFVVTGSGQIGQFWRRELQNQFMRFHHRLTLVSSDDRSFAGGTAAFRVKDPDATWKFLEASCRCFARRTKICRTMSISSKLVRRPNETPNGAGSNKEADDAGYGVRESQ